MVNPSAHRGRSSDKLFRRFLTMCSRCTKYSRQGPRLQISESVRGIGDRAGDLDSSALQFIVNRVGTWHANIGVPSGIVPGAMVRIGGLHFPFIAVEHDDDPSVAGRRNQGDLPKSGQSESPGSPDSTRPILQRSSPGKPGQCQRNGVSIQESS